jgi:hypothetical protein
MSSSDPVSQAKLAFDIGIRDAEELLDHFDNSYKDPPPPENAEVLKRAGLIMACTAWETYVEDRVAEALKARLASEGDTVATRFIRSKLSEELNRFNNPDRDKTRKLFKDFLEIDIAAAWAWNMYDSAKAGKALDELMAKRGQAVHRSKGPKINTPAPHLVTRDELRRAIAFLKSLVDATEKALVAPHVAQGVNAN